MKEKEGCFVVIEGTDGAGKGTQVQLLDEKLTLMKIPHEIIDFPRYGDNTWAEMVQRYLNGEFGGVNEVSPYVASCFYAGDRWLAKPQIEKWLNEGKLVIANRYVSANKGHMTSKVPSEKRVEFLKWLDHFEYKENKIPREDLVILLYVPPEVGQSNVDLKGKREYLANKKRDIHEGSIEHLTKTAEVFKWLASYEKNWQLIECSEHGKMKSREEIHQVIMDILQKKNILSCRTP